MGRERALHSRLPPPYPDMLLLQGEPPFFHLQSEMTKTVCVTLRPRIGVKVLSNVLFLNIPQKYEV